MASVINTNMASLYAQKNLTGAQSALSTSVERLSSGLRINRAKDDAAGLGISEKIKSQVTSLNQGVRNANDAISMVQAAEGSLSEVSTILQRMKELSVQARNESLSTTQRSYISDELVALKKEINAIAERTTFNDLSLLKNALRTDVVTSTATNKLQNGASVLDGIAVSGVTLKNTNAGTYTFSAGTVEQIADQKSRASTELLGTAGSDTTQDIQLTSSTVLTLSGVFEAGDVVSVQTGTSQNTMVYTVLAEDLTLNGDGTGGAVTGGSSTALNNIAKKVAIAFDAASTALTGSSVTGAVVTLVGDTATNAIALNRVASVTDNTQSAKFGAAGNASSTTHTLELSRNYEVGDNISFYIDVGNTVASVSYTVVAEDITSSSDVANDGSYATRQAIATKVATAANTAIAATGVTSATTIVATASTDNVQIADGRNGGGAGSISIVTSTAQTAFVTASTQLAQNKSNSRDIVLKPYDIAEGNKITLTVNGKDYSVVAGNSSTVDTIGAALQNKINADYPSTTASVYTASTDTLTLNVGSGLTVADVSLRVAKLQDGAQMTGQASVVSTQNISTAAAARTITINDHDVVEGRRFTVSVGNPEVSTKYSVIADHDDSAADIATKLSTLLDVNFGSGNTSVTNSVITLEPALNLGMSNISVTARETSEGEIIVSESTVSSKTRAESARTITVNQLDLAAGNVVSVSVRDKEYAVKVGSGDTATSVAYKLAGLLDTDYPNTTAATATTAFPAATRVSVSGNQITLTADAKLGLEKIDVSVRKITNPGLLTITADANTGIGGTSQSLNIGSIAAGASKTFDFDNLGISFTLNNSRATAVDATSFAAYTSRVNQLEVGAQMDGEALFQVGAGTRDTVVLDGFKDIRITGYNQNTGAEKSVFDNINTTLDTIAQNTTASLSEANFATLENQIEDAITTIADFRGYFGAQQNRIEFAISNIQAQSENLAAANSRIVDTDYAAETANLTKTQIMQQAATAMLAQANQMPNVILALLK